MKYAIEITNLKKEYPSFKLEINKLKLLSGQVIGLIGENGAGKTTFIKAILNIIKKEEGSIKILDKDNQTQELEIKENIGIVLDNSFFPELLTAKNINTIMKDTYKNWDVNLFYNYLSEFGIQDNQTLKTMSKGMRKKVELAVSLSHHPKLLILDEPTSGLDPIVRNEVLDIFLKFLKDDDYTILLSTHITSDLEKIADHIVLINKGKIVLEKSREDIIDNYAILKCDLDKFSTIDKSDIISYKKNKYNYEILINNKKTCIKKYKNYIIDPITIEELMLLMTKGEKIR